MYKYIHTCYVCTLLLKILIILVQFYQLAFLTPRNFPSRARSRKRFLARLNSEMTDRPQPLSVHLRLTLVSAVTAGNSVSLNWANMRVFKGKSGLCVMNRKAFRNGSLFAIVILLKRSVKVWHLIMESAAPCCYRNDFDYNRFWFLLHWIISVIKQSFCPDNLFIKSGFRRKSGKFESEAELMAMLEHFCISLHGFVSAAFRIEILRWKPSEIDGSFNLVLRVPFQYAI